MGKFEIGKILRAHLNDLKPYSSARDEFSGEAKIFLDANENPLGSAVSQSYNRYPDPLQREIKRLVSGIKHVAEQNIFIGNGSDEAIDLLIRAFCEPGTDKILIMPPTYGMYKVAADINNVGVVEVPLTNEFQLNLESVIDASKESVNIIFVCSPNNPTGNNLSFETIHQLCKQFHGLVVVDEAYIDFTDVESQTRYLNKFANLVVLQTLSKAWGLAALRLGMAFASKEIIAVLNKIKPPYNISALTQEKVIEALGNELKKNKMVAEILEARSWLLEKLQQIPIVEHVYPTDANFVLIKVDNPNQLYHQLIAEEVVVRNRSNVQLCDGCLRITVGTREENQILIDKLQKV